MHWEEYGEGLRAKTEHGVYVIGPTRCGWWVSFHCACCQQFTQVVPMDSQLERCKTKAVEHQDVLLKRYAEAMARY